MKIKSKYISFIAFLIIGASLPAAQVIAANDQYMVRYCKSAVAKKYDVRQDNISTLPVERSGNHYKVYGQTPKEGQKALLFSCSFDHNSNFTHLNKTADNRRHSGNNHSSGNNNVSVSQMPTYCRGMASEKFHVRPQDITTQAVEQENGHYLVYGYYPPTGNQTSFICKFNSHGKFKHVNKG